MKPKPFECPIKMGAIIKSKHSVKEDTTRTMILETERLLLRDFTIADVPDIEVYQTDPRYLRFYHWTTRSPGEIQQFVQMFLDWQQQKPRTKYQLVIVLKAQKRVIGNCGVRCQVSGDDQGEIGYEINPNYWGKGYATEAANGIIRFGFETLNLHRIWATCIAENTASARVLEKVGMRQEGHFVEKEWMKGRWWDVLQFALLRREWLEFNATS